MGGGAMNALIQCGCFSCHALSNPINMVFPIILTACCIDFCSNVSCYSCQKRGYARMIFVSTEERVQWSTMSSPANVHPDFRDLVAVLENSIFNPLLPKPDKNQD